MVNGRQRPYAPIGADDNDGAKRSGPGGASKGHGARGAAEAREFRIRGIEILRVDSRLERRDLARAEYILDDDVAVEVKKILQGFEVHQGCSIG